MLHLALIRFWNSPKCQFRVYNLRFLSRFARNSLGNVTLISKFETKSNKINFKEHSYESGSCRETFRCY